MYIDCRKTVAAAIAALAAVAMVVPNAMADTADTDTGVKTQTKLEQGAPAYFADKGATDAVKVLTDKTVNKYADAVKIGDTKDASSIDNMISAVTYIQACNKLRDAAKLPELRVTDTLMAIAIADADYAAANDTSSSNQFDVKENIASGDDPFHIWFEMNNGKVSYQNILSKDFAYTGFGVSKNSVKTKYPVQLQAFSAAAAPQGLDAGRTMTADDYLKDLEEWKSDPESSKPVVDKTILQQLIEEAKKLHQSDWPEQAWKNLQDKIAEAEKIIADTKATVEDVKKAAQALSDAIKALSKPASSFKDVTRSTPHYEDINWLVDQKITEGFPDNTFRPAANVVRQDMAAFLYRLAGKPAYTPTAEDKARFSDVDESTPHHDEIWWLASSKITEGFDDHTFRPMANVNRQDMAAFLHRLAQYKGHDETPDNTVTFTDVQKDVTPHYGDIMWLSGYSITEGFDDHTFRGAKDVIRQDMAAFLHRTYEYVLNKQ